MSTKSQIQPDAEIANLAPMTLEEYFEMELVSETRHEYNSGYIQAMAYTSINHARILWNLNRELGNCLRGKACEGFGSDRMLFIPNCEGKARIFYPDMTIVCGEKELYQYKEKMVALLNPSVLIEVSSDTTMEDDFVNKWRCYKKLPSLKQYIIISQREKYIIVFNRTDNAEEWLHTTLDADENTLKILDCEIKVKDIYENVE
jgi:Uma2 family endonuclease